MLTIEKLRAYGANVDEGLGRCMNNEAFYLRLVNMAVGDAGFERLHTALKQGDRKEGFEAAHAGKPLPDAAFQTGLGSDRAPARRDGDRDRDGLPCTDGRDPEAEGKTAAAER